jgi:(2Fe-2S) ferredoxin
MGLLKQLSRGIPFGKKTSEPSVQAPAQGEKAARIEGFCDPEGSMACMTVCAPNMGCKCGCEAVRKSLNEEIARRGLNLVVGDAKTGCGGNCKGGPFIGFPRRGFFYLNVQPDDVPEIIEETIVHGRFLFPFLSINPDRAFRSDIYYEKETGLLAAIDDSVCMVDTAKYFLDFEEGLSCGKCIPCRLGIKRMQETMKRIVSGEGTWDDIEQIKLLCQTMKDTPFCDFAVTSSRPVLSAITYFEDEFKAHIEGRQCPSGACKDLVALDKKLAVGE